MSDEFKRVMRGLASNEILIPTIHAALYDPSFKGFNVQVETFSPRPYDGKFHPSTHSTWTVRQLYVYLVAHEWLETERMPLTGVFAVTQGKFWHDFLQNILLSAVLLVKHRDFGGPINPAEVPIRDPEHNRFGHADGRLVNRDEGLEIKTINGFQVEKVTSEDVLRQKKPGYWAQTQDYLDVLGLSAMRYLMLNPDYPFKMKEFVVSANKAYQARRRDEYQLAMLLAQEYPDVRELENPNTPIPICDGCGIKSTMAKECPARRVCPIGKLAAA